MYVCCSSRTSVPTSRSVYRTSHDCFPWPLPRSHFCLYPRRDGLEDEDLPKGAGRSEKFVDVANEYFEHLDVRCMHRSVNQACTLT